MDNRPIGSERGSGPQHGGPAATPLALAAFRRHGERHLARHFNSVRLGRAHHPDFTAARDRPLIVYCNHSSWWDPLVCLQLAAQLLPERRHFAPIPAGALAGSRFLSGIGFYTVDDQPGRHARFRRHLDAASQVLEEPGATLWIAPSWRLADPRQRPVEVRPWFGQLVHRLHRGVLLPLAMEFPFWDALLPEALVGFGQELAIEDAGMRARDWTAVLAAHLQEAQDQLAADAQTHDPNLFEPLLGAGAAAAAAPAGAARGGLPAVWRRLQAHLRRRREHGRGPLRPSSQGEDAG